MTNIEAEQPNPDRPGEPRHRREHSRQSLGRNVASTLVAQGISWISALFVVTMVPRYLGPEGVGQLRIATTIWLIAIGFIAFGTNQAVMLQIARSEDNFGPIAAAAIWLRVLLWTVALAVVFAILFVLDVDRTLIVLAAIAGVGALATGIGNVGRSALQGLENFGSLAKVSSSAAIALPIMIGAAILFDLGLYAIAVSLALLPFITAFALLSFAGRFGELQVRTTGQQIRSIARQGLPYLLGGVALMLYREADTVVMAALVDDEQIGWYSTADRLSGTALVGPTVLMTAMLPLLARTHADNPDRARTMAEQAFRTLVLAGLPAGVGLALISGRLATVLFGEEFREAGPVLAGFGLVLALIALTTLVGHYAIAIGRERLFFLMLLAAAFATVPLDVVFVSFFNRNYDNGAIGGTASFAVTEATILAAGIVIFIPTVLSRPTLVRVVKVATATAIMTAAIYPIRAFYPVVPVLVGATVFGLSVLALRTLEEHELEMLAPALRRLPPALQRPFGVTDRSP